ncbi:DUF4265 domain-containing protein [Nonomuraea sp. NPDC059194]|uniref:DUF4265 domain-containing protein n=1 Tax=Nonomuraea sp. NPDC059194 TaxID=3346764 RepID=UPI00369E28ED
MQFIVHDNPVGRSSRNYIAHVDLDRFGLAGQKEQLWLCPCEEGDYVVACLPFRVYGLALGDRVRLSADGSTIVEVIERSGHRVLRALIMPRPDQVQFMERVTGEVVSAGLVCEWSGDRHVAIDVPPEVSPDGLFATLHDEVAGQRAYWEWGDAAAF